MEEIDEKQCNTCKEFWPADLEFFYRNAKNTTDGLNGRCKACDYEAAIAKRKESKHRAQAVHI